MRVYKIGLAMMLAILLITPLGTSSVETASAAADNLCHFGIAAPAGISGYDLSLLGVGSYLDWGSARNPSVPAEIAYFHVLRVSDAQYESVKSILPVRLTQFPGAVWIIGNEPDSEVPYQDHISAESYGDRYYELASIIRTNDPSARIAFGTIIQPTEIRMAYLQKALDRLVVKAGNKTTALGLIDIYSTHAFILNEEQMYEYDNQGNIIRSLSWGAGWPIGYTPNANWGTPETITVEQTYSIDLYKSRILRFRQWMKDNGDQNKPLWVTEYGSLMPTWLNVSENTTATFMEQTFDYTLRYTDPNLGYAPDKNRLVQHLVWYSLNEDLLLFGGSLFNPANKQRTLVGDRFVSYNPPADIEPPGDVDVAIVSKAPRALPGGPGAQAGTFTYRIVVRATNLISSNRMTTVKVDLYDGDRLVGSATGNLPRCGGEGEFTIMDQNSFAPGAQVSYRAVVSLAGAGTETNPSNQEVVLPQTTMPPVMQFFLPSVIR